MSTLPEISPLPATESAEFERLRVLGLVGSTREATPRYIELEDYAARQLRARGLADSRAEDMVVKLIEGILANRAHLTNPPAEPATLYWLKKKLKNAICALSRRGDENTEEFSDVLADTLASPEEEQPQNQVETLQIYEAFESFLATLPSSLLQIFDAWHLHPDHVAMAAYLKLTVMEFRNRLARLKRLGKVFWATFNSSTTPGDDDDK
jgi:DNA-directed RNA polymerase specialized sigma24 family protein